MFINIFYYFDIIFFILSLYFESLALKKFDVMFTYIIWVSSGIILISMYSVLVLNESISTYQTISLSIMMLGLSAFVYTGMKGI